MCLFSSNYEHYLSIYITRRATKFGIYDFILGAKLTAEYGTGFRFNTLSDGLRRNYLDGKDEFKDVQFVITRTSNDIIQMVLTDPHGGVQSIQVATLMKADIDQGW